MMYAMDQRGSEKAYFRRAYKRHIDIVLVRPPTPEMLLITAIGASSLITYFNTSSSAGVAGVIAGSSGVLTVLKPSTPHVRDSYTDALIRVLAQHVRVTVDGLPALIGCAPCDCFMDNPPLRGLVSL